MQGVHYKREKSKIGLLSTQYAENSRHQLPGDNISMQKRAIYPKIVRSFVTKKVVKYQN